MSGRNARPSQAGKLAGQTARIAPALAVTGALLGMPSHQPPPTTTPAAEPEHVELASSVEPASIPGPAPETSSAPAPAPHATPRTYIVQAGDTLWSIAQRFYGNPEMWSAIYHANEIQDPNEIFVDQKLLIPQAGSTAPAATTATPAPAAASATPVRQGQSPLPGVPGVAAYYIRQAARGTGLPMGVVAAQNYVESSYGENMGPSSAGAMGPWQFEPYTWPSYSPAPFSLATNWSASTQAYINLMSQLLQWSGGNMQMALAAYNAGQANWQAGLGYADEILSIAGQG